MTLVKICGLRRPVDLEAAVSAGADALGFVFYKPSHRYVTPERAVELLAPYGRRRPFHTVGVFVDEPVEWVAAVAAAADFDYVQLCGSETAVYCRAVGRPVIRALSVRTDADLAALVPFRGVAEYVLLDAYRTGYYGGTGRTFDWELARPALAEHRVILAGGLTAENVVAAVDALRPHGVDVSSGVETDQLKDAEKIRAFVRSVRSVEAVSY